MYQIVYNITINGKRLNYLSKLEVNTNVEDLADSATISLPSHYYNKAIGVRDLIKVGDKVEISVGYNGKLEKEFSGYVQKITDYGDEVQIICEDDVYLLRLETIPNQVLTNISLSQLFKKLLPKMEVICAYEFSYSSFTCNNLTAFKLLKLIQDETKADIFIKDGKLYVQPAYTVTTDKVVAFKFAKNIQSDGLSLEYKTTEDRALQVVAKGKTSKGAEIEAKAGKAGEDVFNIELKGATTKENLQTLADEIYSRKCYDGLEGSFSAWLIPRVEAGWSVELIDKDEKRNNGRYFVTATDLSVSEAGCTRKVSLGKRLTY